MKRFLGLFAMLCFVITSNAQAQSTTINGAWEFKDGATRHLLLVQDSIYFYTVHQDQEFMMSQGGKVGISGDKLTGTVWYNTADSLNVGQDFDFPFTLSGKQLSITAPEVQLNFTHVDEGKAPLAGVWRITGRMQDDGKIGAIHQTGTRHTYKMLTGTKFQWVAIDPAKKQFSGTGGGSYTFKGGKYTENIEFFSRDNSRVGASLTFDGKLENGNWHHSGLSSKGAKIYEVWSKK
ncbi:hypothetical protein IWX76_000809 [Pedobacter sp. CAN_A7]|uniref:hypothetical protein n=1 Tax=Pedobacter sp. CAN_A7 TaxID=2787722 RepID=UPI0018C9F349